jgi:hypothetical protein
MGPGFGHRQLEAEVARHEFEHALIAATEGHSVKMDQVK